MSKRATIISKLRGRRSNLRTALLTVLVVLFTAQQTAAAIVNTVRATGTGIDGKPITSKASATVNVVKAAPAISIAKSGTVNLGSDGILNAGDTIAYAFTVKNTGNVTLSNVSVTDPKVTVAGGPLATLAPDASDATTFTANYTITQKDIDAGHVANTAVATGSDPGGGTVTGNGGTDTTLAGSSTLTLVKRGTLNPGADGIANAGDTITYRFVVTNTGTTTLTDITITDPKLQVARVRTLGPGARLALDLPAPDGPLVIARLLPGKKAALSADYVLTQADIDAGKVDNTATATGAGSSGSTVTATDSATVTIAPAPAISIVKAGTLDLGADKVASIGDTITYTFTVTNTGNLTLSNVTVTDPLVLVKGGPLASLAPGASDSSTFTAIYKLKQADIDAGQVTNQATASGKGSDGATVQDLSDATSMTADNPTIVTLTAEPKIALVKAVGTIADTNGDGKTDAGDTIDYKLTVTNTGNVTLTNVTVADSKATVAGGPIASLPPGKSDATTFTASHVLSQDDLDTGTFTNQATATGTAPDGATATDLSDAASTTADNPTDTPLPQQPGIALVKKVASITDVNGNGLNDTGDIINYAFEVTNTGTVTLTNIAVSDPLVPVTGGPIASLAPGVVDKTTLAAHYTVTANDLKVGEVVNQAAAAGTAPDGKTVSDLSDNSAITGDHKTVVVLDVKPAIALVKQVKAIVDKDGSGSTNAGDEIDYQFIVQNTGNIALGNVTVTDPKVAVTGGPLVNLDPGATDSTTFTAAYVLTADDIAAGQVVNQAVAAGTAGSGQVVTDKSGTTMTDDNATVTQFNQAPAIALIKKVSTIDDANHDGITGAGDIIHYAFLVKNTGNVALTNVTVDDPKVQVQGGPLASLAPGSEDDTTFTAAYTITQADVDKGGVSNQATASGEGPTGAVTDKSDGADFTGSNPTETAIQSASAIALVKKIGTVDDTNGDGVTDAGDVIHYQFAVTNTGNQTLHHVAVTDPKVKVQGGPLATLLPGATDDTTFTAAYHITYADAQAGQVVNQATATGKSPDGTVVSDLSDDQSIAGNDPTTITVVKNKPGFTKTALLAKASRGDLVPFDIVATAVVFKTARVVDIMPPGFIYGGQASVIADGVSKPITPSINGRYLTFTGLHPDSHGAIKIRLYLIVGPVAPTGRVINKAELYDNLSQTPVATAQAALEIAEIAVFDCGDIIGRVFDDKNRSGYPDDSEPGLPGVRIATVNGLLVTTDKDGRFHVACAALPDPVIGSNFVMKLDTRTLPTGYALTTENPRDVRLTAGKMAKLNFGAALTRLVRVTLKDAAFVTGQATLKPQFAGGIAKLLKTLDQSPSSLLITYQRGPEKMDLANQRVAAVRAAIEAAWAKHNQPYVLSIDSRVIGGN